MLGNRVVVHTDSAMKDYTLRAMTIADYDAASALWQRVEGMSLGASDTCEQIARFLEKNRALSFVCEIAGECVGTILCSHDCRRGYIYHLAVDADHRGNGIGSRLVTTCTELLKQQGIMKCTILVFRSNEAGNRFWKRMGWEKRDDVTAFSLSLE